VSADGEWIAYVSNETGQNEIYIQRFPQLGEKKLVSTGGGLDPMWSPDGTRLYYLRNPPTGMMVVPIDTRSPVTVGTPHVVFERQYYRTLPGTRTHSIAADGSRLLMIKTNDTTTRADQLHVVLNWYDELRRLLPASE